MTSNRTDPPNLRKKIKRLLQQGKKGAKISKELNLPRSKVDKIIKDIIESKKRWNKKSSGLHRHMELIEQLIEQNKSTGVIHCILQARDVKASLSTVYRFVKKVRSHKKTSFIPFTSKAEASVSFQYVGKFYKKKTKLDVWIFCLQLRQSRYAYYKEVTDATIASFIHCHVEAFQFLKGVPPAIVLNVIDPAIIERECFLKAYGQFLKYFNIQHKNASSSDKENCYLHLKYFFLLSIVHKQYERLSKELRTWFLQGNVDQHSSGKISIKKFFEQMEAPLLLPLKTYPTTGKCIRFVNLRGFVFFEYNLYEVPKVFCSKPVQLMFYYKSLKIYSGDELVAVHLREYGKGNKIKLA